MTGRPDEHGRDPKQGAGRGRASDRVLALLADYLADNKAGPVEVFYDAPLSLSGELARRTREVFASRGLAVQATAVPVPERLLSGFASGPSPPATRP